MQKERLYNHKYWSPSDGECTLDNPIVWDNLKKYVYAIIKSTPYITKNNFIEAEDVLILVKDELMHMHPTQYGGGKFEPISFLCKKISTQIGREWWKYLKTVMPHEFDRLRSLQKEIRSKARAEGKYKNTESRLNKAQQKKLRSEIAEPYLVQLVYHYLRHNTGIKYSFEEIRAQFPHLIEQKRQEVIKRRIKNAV